MDAGRSVTVRPTWFKWGIHLVIAPQGLLRHEEIRSEAARAEAPPCGGASGPFPNDGQAVTALEIARGVCPSTAANAAVLGVRNAWAKPARERSASRAAPAKPTTA